MSECAYCHADANNYCEHCETSYCDSCGCCWDEPESDDPIVRADLDVEDGKSAR